VKRRSPRRYPSSLQWFSRDELAPFPTLWTFSMDATGSRARAYP